MRPHGYAIGVLPVAGSPCTHCTPSSQYVRVGEPLAFGREVGRRGRRETRGGNPQVHMAHPVARALTAARSSRGNHRNKRLFMDTEGALQVRRCSARCVGELDSSAPENHACQLVSKCLPASCATAMYCGSACRLHLSLFRVTMRKTYSML